jgi:signal transduction histidine kinase/DNA-binding response OmpR family regulator
MNKATNHTILLLASDPSVADGIRRIAAQMISWVDRPTDGNSGRPDAAGFRSWDVEEVHGLPEALHRIRQAMGQQVYSLMVLGSATDDEMTLMAACTELLNADRFLPLVVCSETAYRRREEISAILAAPERFLIVAPPLDESLVRHWLAAQADRRDARLQLQQCRRDLTHARASSVRAEQVIEDVTRAKADFLSNISHEVRTPMNAILGFSRLLLQAPHSAEQAEKLGFIQSAASSLMEILENMLDLALLSEGKILPDSEVFRLDMVFKELVDTVGPTVRGKELGLYCHIEEAIPRWVEGDQVRLRQILGNLVSNALKFTEYGSIHIRATLDEMDGDDITVRIVVSDTGVGIPADRQTVIFESFSQADGSTTRRFGGVGIGLSICKQLLDLLGGQIGFRSTVGEGSSFWFTIPLKRHRSSEAEEDEPALCRPAPSVPSGSNAPAARPREGKSTTHRVLVADSDPLTRSILELLLTRAGCFVDLVSDAPEALSVLETDHYDLIFLDMRTPEENLRKIVGKLAGEWNRTGGKRSTKLMALGDTNMATGRQWCVDIGADDFLAKPFTAEALFELIGRHLPGWLGSPQDSGANRPAEVEESSEPYVALPQWILRLHEALKQQNFKVLEHSAHALKNLAARWGSRDLADHAMRIQLAARNNDIHRAAAAIQRLVVCCNNDTRWCGNAPVPVAN